MTPGTRLGPYEVLSLLGAGGMGEVYRAKDSTLKREVALKVLPADVAKDRERLARFQREAEVLASLNHPHIAQIYGLEHAGDTFALVMELVEGEDLAQRIARGPIPLDDALPIARQIAEALEAAHEHGIIHRDLKPANIKVRADGTVKVLDFGLAKAIDPAAGSSAAAMNSPTLSIHATAAGIILGTAAYMSPEQARGKPVDKRTDIWAFGCVLYEMLTGAPAFAGQTTTDVLSAVVRADPDWVALPAATPANVNSAIRRCLVKDAKQRLRDIGDVRQELERPAETPIAVVAGAPSHARRWLVPGISVLVAILAVGGAWWWKGGVANALEWSAAAVGGPQIAYFPRLSPDRRTLAFIAVTEGQSQVGILNPGSGDWSMLTRERNRGAVSHVAWSSDGARLYFDRVMSNRGDVWSVAALGGEPRLVVENATAPEPLPDGSVLVARANREGQQQLHRYRPNDGTVVPLPVRLQNGFVTAVRAFPDGREAVVFGCRLTDPPGAVAQLYVVDIESGKLRGLSAALNNVNPDREWMPLAVSSDGRFVFTVRPGRPGSAIVAVPRDGGDPRPLFTTTARVSGIAEGTAGEIYIDQSDRTTERLRISPVNGAVESLSAGLASPGSLVLPDGRTVYSERAGARYRLVASRPHEERLGFSDIHDDPRPPMVLLNDREFALVSGTIDQPVITIASAADGRLIRRLDASRGKALTGLAVSADRSQLFFGHGGAIWSMPIAGGEPRHVSAGSRIAFDPAGQFSLIERETEGGYQIIRRDLDGRETPLALPPGVSFVGNGLWPSALTADGRLAVVVASQDSWFWMPAILNIRTGAMTRVPVQYAGDVQFDVSWDGDHILASALRMESKLFRFTPATAQ